MSKHTIILTENQVKGILEKRKKVVRNDEGEVVPEKCDKCGAEIGLYIQGEPVYLCSKCHKYFGTMPFNLHEGKTNVSNMLKATVPCNEGKNYVNMGVDVREGGRHAVKMTVDEFKQEMIHAYHMYAMEQEAKYKYDLQLTPTTGNFVYSLCYNNKLNKKSKYASALYDDIWGGKYKFDSENVDAYGGIKMSKKGFPYIQCAAGGDWECPVCFFVYFDGNKFRGYVPLKGNALNRDEKHAFSGGGNEPDAKFVQKELGIDYEEADHMCGDIDYNVDACLEDFLSRVDVKGTYKKRDYTKDEEAFKQYRKEKIADEKKRSEEAERRRQMNAQAKLGEPSEGKDLAVPITEAVTGEDDKKAAAIYAYCESEDGNDYCILCAKRLEGDEKGKYNPPMGHLHVGESPKDGAVRECEEESGVKIPKSKLKLGSKESWGTNYYVYLDGTIKDWPIGEGDEENETFKWIPMKDIVDGNKKDWKWAWSTKDFAKQFAPKDANLTENKGRKTIILSEEQMDSIQKQLFTEAFSPKRQVVSRVRDYLDNSFSKSSVDDINDNGYPIKVPIVNMLSVNGGIKEGGQPIKQMKVRELLSLLDDKFHNLVKNDKQRKALLKQIIIDWFNGDITKEGLLSKNTITESSNPINAQEFGERVMTYANELAQELQNDYLNKLGLSIRFNPNYNFSGKRWLAAYERTANGLSHNEIIVAINLGRLYKMMKANGTESDDFNIKAQARISLGHEVAHGLIDYFIDYYDGDCDKVQEFRNDFFDGTLDEEEVCETFGEYMFPEATNVWSSELASVLVYAASDETEDEDDI